MACPVVIEVIVVRRRDLLDTAAAAKTRPTACQGLGRTVAKQYTASGISPRGATMRPTPRAPDLGQRPRGYVSVRRATPRARLVVSLRRIRVSSESNAEEREKKKKISFFFLSYLLLHCSAPPVARYPIIVRLDKFCRRRYFIGFPSCVYVTRGARAAHTAEWNGGRVHRVALDNRRARRTGMT